MGKWGNNVTNAYRALEGIIPSLGDMEEAMSLLTPAQKLDYLSRQLNKLKPRRSFFHIYRELEAVSSDLKMRIKYWNEVIEVIGKSGDFDASGSTKNHPDWRSLPLVPVSKRKDKKPTHRLNRHSVALAFDIAIQEFGLRQEALEAVQDWYEEKAESEIDRSTIYRYHGWLKEQGEKMP